MAGNKIRVISLTKKPGQTFGFYLRMEHGEEGHLIRCLEMGSPAELAGLKDGDRILRVNGIFVDEMPHSEVVDMVRRSGASVTFHIQDEVSYKQNKAQGANLSSPQSDPVANGVTKHAPKPKLCYLVKSGPDYGFSIRSVRGEQASFMTQVVPGSIAHKGGVRANDRLLEVNGENIEDCTYDQVVDKITQAGSSVMFLLVDNVTDMYYQHKHVKIGSWLATTEYLPHKPRIVEMTKDSDGYGLLLKEGSKQAGHIIKEIDKNSPAERAGVKEMDRLVAVNGKEVDNCSHEQVVDRIRQSGNKCCLLVVDKDTDQMYKLGKVSPILFYEDMKDSNAPPSYTEAINLPASVQPVKPAQEREEELKPKLCKIEKTSALYGFHLNSIQGVYGHYFKEVVKGGAADRAGLEDDDFLVEVNGVNVEKCSHEEVAGMIQRGGNSLELLVATKSVYDKLTAKGVPITRMLLGERAYVQVHSEDAPETSVEKRHEDESRPETLIELARERSSSSSSEDSMDERF